MTPLVQRAARSSCTLGRVGEVRDLSSARSARSGAADHELRLPAERHAPRIARHWVMRTAAAAGVVGPLNQVIEVLTAELVADVVRTGDPDGVVRIGLRVADDAVRVTVTASVPLSPAPPNPASLALVEVLSTSWGTRPHGDGERTVWFDVAIAS